MAHISPGSRYGLVRHDMRVETTVDSTKNHGSYKLSSI